MKEVLVARGLDDVKSPTPNGLYDPAMGPLDQATR